MRPRPIAVGHGCFARNLETHSYEALGFYQKRGYEVFGTLEDYPPGHTQVFPAQAARPILTCETACLGT